MSAPLNVAPGTPFVSPEQTEQKGYRWRRAFMFARGQRATIVAIALVTVTAGALSACEPLLIRAFVDALVERDLSSAFSWGVGALLALYVLRDLLSAGSNWLTWRTRLRVQHTILDATVGRLHSLSVAYHRTQPVGSLLTQLDRGVQGLVAAFSELAFGLVPTFAFLVLSAILMLKMQWRLALLLLTMAPMPALIGAWAAPMQTRRERTLLDRWVKIYSRFNEVLSGIVTVKSFAMEHEEKQRFVHQVDEANGLVVKGVGFDARIGALQGLCIGVTKVVVMGYGAYLTSRQEISVGTLLAFWGYVGGLFGPVQSLTGMYQSIRKARVALDTIFDILDADEHVKDGPGAHEALQTCADVRFENIHFGYGPGKRVIENLNLHIAAGETVALVGPSGGGKTTLAVLLQRLYDPNEGRVLINGIDIRQMKQKALRQRIGVVLQEAWLFNDSVRANIAYGRPDAPQEEVERAARAANAHEFITELPEGYETVVGERGNLLSAGQRQRIAIARALLKNPQIVILDEATSALDAESEAAVQEALDRLLEGRTTLVIAHRLATVVRAHRICVLRDGEILQEGTHAQLLNAGGYYAHLVSLQTRGLVSDLSPRRARTDSHQADVGGAPDGELAFSR